MRVPRVFVSYSHEDRDHNSWVEALAADLRKKGVDASLDKWDMSPGGDVPVFMESQIRDSDFVVLVCTPTYAEKSNIPRGGVGYEKNIISAELLQASDLRPKFIPVVKKGDLETALPTYLGSKFAIDFRDASKRVEALEELLRVIYGQPHPRKPPLGRGPYDERADFIATPQTVSTKAAPMPDVGVWEREARGRFDHLREQRLHRNKSDPFARGFWQASFVLQADLPRIGLQDFLAKLRAAETGRTGWDVCWVPTRGEIAAYPFRDGVEVWLADDGESDPAHSDFWRAETSGRLALFRGYQEDGPEFPKLTGKAVLDFNLVLWRVSEVLLYLENFARQIEVPGSGASLRLNWTGLGGRVLSNHRALRKVYEEHLCRQDSVSSQYEVLAAGAIKTSLIRAVHQITFPLFEAFGFFSLSEQQIQGQIKELFDAAKEAPADGMGGREATE
jgi:transcriptional regulator with XRE-family HTH domain